ncbi:MAG: hypothetical protein V3S81_04215, partial [Anaerolineales bacterium]
MPFGGAPDEFVTADIGITQPDAGDEVRGLRFEGVEVTVEGEQDKDVLLRVTPVSAGAMCQQSIDQFGDQVALWVVENQCVQQDAIRAAVRAEQQVGLVVVIGGEVGCPGSLHHTIVDV